MDSIGFRKPSSPDPGPPVPEITESDRERYLSTIDTSLTPEQVERIVHPDTTYPRQENVLAVHWHPEFVPLKLSRKRFEALFPSRRLELVIPTQHNILLSHGPYAGVEVDCHSRGFNRKVQLLLHFKKERLDRAGTLESMLAHTFKYRSSQLFDLMHTFTKPVEERLQAAARTTAAGEDLVCFVRNEVKKIEALMEEYWEATPAEAVKNKLLRNYLDLLRQEHDPRLIERAQAYVRAVKKIVKAKFPLTYFHRTSEIIEEARSLGGGVVIPHPEQFWPHPAGGLRRGRLRGLEPRLQEVHRVPDHGAQPQEPQPRARHATTAGLHGGRHPHGGEGQGPRPPGPGKGRPRDRCPACLGRPSHPQAVLHCRITTQPGHYRVQGEAGWVIG